MPRPAIVTAVVDHGLGQRALGVGHRGVGDVDAGGEVASGRADEENAQVVAVAKVFDGLGHRRSHLQVQGVELFRPVEGDDRHPFPILAQHHGLVAHVSNLLRLVAFSFRRRRRAFNRHHGSGPARHIGEDMKREDADVEPAHVAS